MGQLALQTNNVIDLSFWFRSFMDNLEILDTIKVIICYLLQNNNNSFLLD